MTDLTRETRSMAKNKRDIELQAKRDELDRVAARLFLEKGYEATSMGQIAQALGVAPNTLYWYYGSKDELLIGVLNHLLATSLQQIPSIHGRPLSEQMAWVLGEFEQSRALITLVHARLEQSEVIRVWHDRFHQLLASATVYSLVAQGVPRQRADMLATVAGFLIEGLLAHPDSEPQRRYIIEWFAQSAGPGLPPAGDG